MGRAILPGEGMIEVGAGARTQLEAERRSTWIATQIEVENRPRVGSPGIPAPGGALPEQTVQLLADSISVEIHSRRNVELQESALRIPQPRAGPVGVRKRREGA